MVKLPPLRMSTKFARRRMHSVAARRGPPVLEWSQCTLGPSTLPDSLSTNAVLLASEADRTRPGALAVDTKGPLYI